MMGGYMGQWMGGGFGPFSGIFSLLLLIVVGFGVFLLVRPFLNGTLQRTEPGRHSSLEILEERYARGEIQRDEYLQKKHDLAG